MRYSVAVTMLAAGVLMACGESSGPASPEPVASVSVSPATDTVLVGATTQFVATVRDAAGNALTGRTVTWATSAEAVATVSPNGLISGVAVGSVTVTATTEGKSGTAAVAVQVRPAIRALSGDNQTDTVGQTLRQPLVIQVTGADAHPAAGVVVSFAMAVGGGSLSASADTTDAAGLGSTVLTLGVVAGPYTVRVSAGGLSGSPVAFMATAVPEAPAVLEGVSGDGQNGFTGRALYDSLVVRVSDRFQNVVSGVSVGWAVTGGGGIVSASSTNTNSSGLATVKWTLGATPGANGLDAVVTDLTPVNFAAIGVWPGTGRIAFTTDRSGDYEIWVVNPDGTGSVNVTRNASWDRNPAWSPDGSRIAFTTCRYGTPCDIAIMNADGTGVTRVTNAPALKDKDNPTWSPDGSQIAFEGSLDVENWDIYVINVDGSGLKNVTASMKNAGNPSWSPDGLRIVFWGRVSSTESRGIHVINADGSGLVRLRDQGGSPAWSPDGSKIAWDEGGIHVMNPDGTGVVKLTDDGFAPGWSPDGSKIVFASQRDYSDGGTEIYSMNADGTGIMRLTRNPAWDHTPDWGR